ncbi:MAG: type II toxin-antitoxin system death-on-curing family toxin [Actinobacteria bacterium]|nr:type II toxin-antitoxin system death-on-curing family toxin [Actinomycetota bacterium]
MKGYYLTLADLLTMHSVSIKLHGGSAGIRDLGALEAAIYRPQTGYYDDLIAQAAALFESLAINHPFIDGNKRVAFAAADMGMHINRAGHDDFAA